MRSLELAVKYLAGDRLIGTAAERAALTTALISGSAGWDINAQQATSAGFLNWFAQADEPNTDGRAIYDLGVGNEIDGDFVIRFKGTFDDKSSTAGRFFFWVSETDNAKAINGEDALVLDFHDDLQIRTLATDSAQGFAHSGSKVGSFSTGNTYYFEFKRDGTTLTGQVFTASDFSTGASSVTSLTLGSGFQGGRDYRYVGFKSTGGGWDWTANGSYQAWDFDDIVIYDNQTSATTATYTFNFSDIPAVYPNLPNGAIFEESDTGKHYMFDGTSTWNEM